MKRKRAFTLIELLVVISVIALLLAIIVPALKLAKEEAKKVQCKTRLRQWGIAIQTYNSDNDGRFMVMSIAWDDQPYPHYIFDEPEESPYGGIMWNIAGINPYVKAFSKAYMKDGVASDMITCPNCSGEYMQRWIKIVNWPHFDFAEIAYSYFAGIDSVDPAQCSPNAKRHLVGQKFSSQRLLMAEILNLDSSDSAYRYNHGRNGWSWNEMGPTAGSGTLLNPSTVAYSPNPRATGRSQLFGDIHVEWREIKLNQNLPTMKNRRTQDWNGTGSGWLAEGFDTSYF